MLDGLNHLQDELCTQSYELMDVRNTQTCRYLLIKKQVDHVVEHAHVSCLTIDVYCMCTMYKYMYTTCVCAYLYTYNNYSYMYYGIFSSFT